VAHNEKDDVPKNHVAVVIATTAGTWPLSGSELVPDHQKLEVALEKAAKALEITNTSGWIATAGGRKLDPTKSYLENQLSNRCTIDFGPVESGGGARA